MASHILVPLDGSELALAAVDYAGRIAPALQWGVVLFSVVSHEGEEHLYMPATPVVEAGPAVWQRWEDLQSEAAAELQQEAAGLQDAMAAPAERLHAAGVHVIREVAVGRPRDVILHRAAADDIGLLVLASHGRTGLQRLFRGSVADDVVKRTHRPAVVIHPFQPEDQRVVLEHVDGMDGVELEAVRRALQ